MGYLLRRLEVAAFRGINRRLVLDLTANLTVVLGHNGTGKSSVLQAVEWGLFGTLQLGGALELRREDAIVNAFATESRALVRLVLGDGTQTMTVIRERRLGRSTTSHSDLVVTIDGETWRDERAAQELQRRLSLTPESFYSAVYLRQDAIGAAVGGTEEERSAVIDRLLGLSYMRDLVEGVTTTTVQREANRLERQIGQEESAGLSTAINLRRLLAEREEQLRERGVAPAQLSTGATMHRLDRAVASLDPAATLLLVELPAWPRAPAMRVAAAQEQLRLLRQRREAALGDVHRVRAILQERAERLRTLLGVTPKVPDDDGRLPTITTEVGALDRQIAAGRAETEELAGLLIDGRAATAMLHGAESRLRALVAEHGSADRIATELAAVQAELERVTVEGRHQRLHAQLLTDAVDVLTRTPQATCPVCGQPTDQPALLRHLRTALRSDRDAHALERLRQQYRELDDRRRQLKDAQDAVGRETDEGERHRAALAVLEERAFAAGHIALGEPLEVALQTRLEQRQRELAEATQRRAMLAVEQRALAAAARQQGSRAAAHALQDALADVATIAGYSPTDDSATDGDLTALVNRAREASGALADRLATMERLGADLDDVDIDLRHVEASLAYLDLKASVERLDAAQPGETERLRQLRAAHAAVVELAAGLERIRAAALAERQSLLDRSLDSLLPLLNDYFQRLGGHPAFGSLTIKPEQVRGNPLYRLLASDASDERTGFLPTRFSRTQRHVAALATFLALSRRLPHNLDLLLLDDPAQSMDLDHQQSLAAVVNEEAIRRQIVVATEDDRFTAILEEIGGATRCKVIELGSWSAAGATLRTTG